MASYYLDQMDVEDGDKVRCFCNILDGNFTIAKDYDVIILGEHKHVINDIGDLVIPSVEFTY